MVSVTGVCVSQDGKASTSMLVCSFLLLCHAFKQPEQALNMFAIKRSPPDLQPSQFRWGKEEDDQQMQYFFP